VVTSNGYIGTDDVDGIWLRGSSNTISDNILNSNLPEDIRLGTSSSGANNNLIYNNYFNNTNPPYISPLSTNNKWNIARSPGKNIIGGMKLGGNFWGNPEGTGFSQTCKVSGDGIMCDISYTLDSNNIDYLPLTRGSSSNVTIPAGGNITIPPGYGKYQSGVIDAGKNVTFISMNLTGTELQLAWVYTTYSVDGANWPDWTEAKRDFSGLYNIAAGSYGRYFGYMIVAPSGAVITKAVIHYVESPDGVVYIQ
jgi:hypothetical protein